MENQSRFLDLRSGVGLIIANMIGAGVFLSAGFMAQDMSAGPLLLAWVFGAVLALCGAIAYGAVAADSGESGGEYRYLSDHIHPFLGYMAGWGSLLLGFSAPIAVDAIAVGAYGNTLVDTGIDPRHIGAFSIVLLCGVHAFHLQTSRGIQNALVALKLVLVLGFVALGLSVGSAAWPSLLLAVTTTL